MATSRPTDDTSARHTVVASSPSPEGAAPAARLPAFLRITPESPAYKWWMAVMAMLSAFLVVASGATVNVALPPIMTTFSLNIDQAQWIITAYMIAGAVLIPTVGWLGNLFGNRNLFLCGLLIFVMGSALCGVAWSGTSLIVFRVIQGIGSGPVIPMAMVFLTEAFPLRQRGLAMGLFGMASAFGPAIGPVIAGYITEYLDWRMVFYMNVVPGLLCMGLVLLIVANTREATRRSLDLGGLCTLALFLVSLMIALSQGQREGWDTPYIQRLLLIAGVSFVLFFIIELRHREPLVDLRLYKYIPFTIISLAMLLNAMSFWGTNFLQTILLQRLMDYTPAQAGYAVLPGALGMAFTTLAAGRLADKIDRRYVVITGLVLFATASYLFASLTLDRSMSWIIWMIVGRYMTIGLIYSPMNAASMMLLPPHQARMGAGLINIMQQGIGGTVGLALMTTVLQRQTNYYANMFDQQQALSTLSWEEVLSPAHTLMLSAGDLGAAAELKAFALLYRHFVQQATVAAYQDCFVLIAAMCVVVIPLVLVLRPKKAE